ncbi:NADPH2:quinone reductase [Paracoccus thiocyanatus]|uniref:NADPH2:quinone reductase n=1 Tax=Paracoccus thiocyanatus TaxID=34006 RepID=A0A1N6PWI7_9RHOB|nr:NAD(P)H-quinone oxidoreductase [Paracoccus thiocyanatus]SIQ08693.1 NADPH2:quinone reductase [Paracoccus thiocyanatus]
MTTMQICHAPQPGGPDALRFLAVPRPEPGPGQVLIRVGAVGVNRLDAMQRAGNYPLPPGVNPVLGVEVGGEVVATGPEVHGIAVGMRVAALLEGGGYAEFACADHRHVAPVPQDWDDIRAAAVIETFCTAHETLFELSRLAPGERVLIHAGGSAVGSTAIRMAQAVGAEIATTTGREDKADRLRAMGVPHVLNYRQGDFAAALREIWPEGLDVVEDFVGPANLARHIDLLRWRGRIALVGLLSQGMAEFDVAKVLTRMIQLRGFTLRPHSAAEKAAVVARFRQRWLPELAAGRIAPDIHAVLPFGDAVQAHRILEAADNFGKIILRM